MNYIKLFESFNNELIKYIGFTEYSNFIKNKENIDFSEREIEKIKSISLFDMFQKGKAMVGSHKTGRYNFFQINKFEDNWYIIQKFSSMGTGNRYYKCDDFESVIEFLENIKKYFKI